LLSSSGITYAQHFCGELEMMSKITLGEAHLSCGMEMKSSPCEDERGEEGHSCCDNEYTAIDVDDNFAAADADFQLQTTFLVAFASAFIFQQPDNFPNNHNFFKDYSPPPLGADLHVLYETFLI